MVEVDLAGRTWVKSSFSGQSDKTSCVEIAAADNAIFMRCSRHRAGPRLAVPLPAWRDLVDWTAGT